MNVSIVNDLSDQFYRAVLRRGQVACDTETTGLDPIEDELALVQFCIDDRVEMIRATGDCPPAARSVLERSDVAVTFHHAMFDVRFLMNQWHVWVNSVLCTKIQSKLLQYPSFDQGLKSLVHSKLGVSLNKSGGVRMSDWRAASLSAEQMRYAARDVLYLHELHEVLLDELRAAQMEFAYRAAVEYVPARAQLDLLGIGDVHVY